MWHSCGERARQITRHAAPDDSHPWLLAAMDSDAELTLGRSLVASVADADQFTERPVSRK
jgi:hypothetical protein